MTKRNTAVRINEEAFVVGTAMAHGRCHEPEIEGEITVSWTAPDPHYATHEFVPDLPGEAFQGPAWETILKVLSLGLSGLRPAHGRTTLPVHSEISPKKNVHNYRNNIGTFNIKVFCQ